MVNYSSYIILFCADEVALKRKGLFGQTLKEDMVYILSLFPCCVKFADFDIITTNIPYFGYRSYSNKEYFNEDGSMDTERFQKTIKENA